MLHRLIVIKVESNRSTLPICACLLHIAHLFAVYHYQRIFSIFHKYALPQRLAPSATFHAWPKIQVCKDD